MAELGSVFEDESDDPRGPDLRVTVEVPRAALGAGIRVPVPRRLAHEGELVERAVLDHDDPDRVALHLPDELAPRTMLRLRGQGGGHPSGRAGDLQIVVELVDRAPRDDETITRDEVPAHEGTQPTNDITAWVLLGLALLAGGVVLAVTLL